MLDVINFVPDWVMENQREGVEWVVHKKTGVETKTSKFICRKEVRQALGKIFTSKKRKDKVKRLNAASATAAQ